jgi:hypothetical protein
MGNKGVKIGERCEDVEMWRCGDVGMRRCGDVLMC